WERTCNELACTHTLYPQQRYYYVNDRWRSIDRNFYSTPCQTNYAFCVVDNLYQVQMNSYADATDPIAFTYQNLTFQFKPMEARFTALGQQQTINSVRHSPAQVQNYRAQYSAAFHDSIDLAFTYLPQMFKEELIVRDMNWLSVLNLSAAPENIMVELRTAFTLDAATTLSINGQAWNRQTRQSTQEFITLTKEGTSVYLTPPLAYDAHLSPIQGTYVIEKVNDIYYLMLQIPYRWFIDEARVYPVIVDPTITLYSDSITWDGNVLYNTGTACPEPPSPCNNPSRNSIAATLSVGDLNNSPSNGYTRYRADMDWDVSSLPDQVSITNIDLTVYVGTLNTNNDELRFYHMIGGNAHYPNDDTGNTNFYNDVYDGTNYLNTTLALGVNPINLTASSQLKTDLETLLLNGTDLWSLGFRSEESGVFNAAPTIIASSEGNDGEVPYLTITYEPTANETEGDAAIAQGIQNIIPNAVIHDTQQVYIRTSSNTQQLGTYDKFTLNDTKRWSMNYITSGETFANMQNLTETVFFLEITNLLATDITQRVQDFINGTA
ncbi:MAG: hypothetical protein Q8L34_06360, partial [Candidatus Woesearchaeota archaeon]|nr:hypothetical protein [Candidatus Woesearchaeota archaeon]